MVFHSCLNNLKGFTISRPPIVVFTLCLTALAIATLSLARFVSNADSLPNPDVRLDWNLLLERLANLDLCVLPDKTPKMSANMTFEGDEETVTALLGVAKELHSTLHNNTMISGSIDASLLGLKGSHMLTISFRMDVNASAVHLPSNVCATFSGPRIILPQTQTPPACTTQGSSTIQASGRLTARAQGPQMVDNWCDEGTFLRLAYSSNPSLTAMLTLHDRSVVNLHLMHTSYFLLVMAMTLVCYALLRGGKNKPQTTIEKVPLDP